MQNARHYIIYDSKRTVIMAITAMPKIKALNCFNDSLGSVSVNKSGNTVTKAICKKPPAVNGIIHDVRASAKRKIIKYVLFKFAKKYKYPLLM